MFPCALDIQWWKRRPTNQRKLNGSLLVANWSQKRLLIVAILLLIHKALNMSYNIIMQKRAVVPIEYLPNKPARSAAGHPDYIKIMTWGSRYDGDTRKYWFHDVLGTAAFHSCPESRCLLTDKLSQSDAVLISVNQLAKWVRDFKLPKRSSPKQKWIFYAWESPQRFPIKPEYLTSRLFNATFTYKNTSDIYYPYGRIEKRDKPWTLKYNESWVTKKNVAWIASDCPKGKGRQDYVEELAKHIDVTIMGGCSNATCPGDDGGKLAWSPCYKHVQEHFKFYLAFENSVCDEYATEKLWRTLRMHVIPVVYGKPGYRDLLPQRSIIDVRDFQSPRHLAQYLHKLSDDAKLYSSYFSWRKQHKSFENTLPEAVCKLCEYLHQTKNDPPRTVDLEKFWNVERDCVPQDDFLKSLGLSL